MTTESSYRFERQVDPLIADVAALRAAELMAELAGGQVAEGVVDVFPVKAQPSEIAVRPERVNAVLGVGIGIEEMAGLLASLGIAAEVCGESLVCSVPTFRPDVTREIDLVEEIGRVYGYDRLEATLPDESLQGRDSKVGLFGEKVRRTLMACGAQEALTHSLVDEPFVRVTGVENSAVRLRNPLTEDLCRMRAMLTPNLLQVVARNQSFETTNVSVFEIGKVYFQDPTGEIGERLSVAGAMTGSLWRRLWSLPETVFEVDFYTCRGLVESLLDSLGITGVAWEAATHELLHPTRGAKLTAGGREIGIVGEASQRVLRSLDVRGRVCIYELDFEALMALAPEVPVYVEPARYPALYRHLAVVAKNNVEYAELERVVRSAGREAVERVDVLDVYKGEPIDADERSITLSLTFRASDKTLTDEETNGVLAEIREALVRELGVSFR